MNMTREQVQAINTGRRELEALDPTFSDPDSRPGVVWREEWQGGECRRVQVYVNGRETNPDAYIASELARLRSP